MRRGRRPAVRIKAAAERIRSAVRRRTDSTRVHAPLLPHPAPPDALPPAFLLADFRMHPPERLQGICHAVNEDRQADYQGVRVDYIVEGGSHHYYLPPLDCGDGRGPAHGVCGVGFGRAAVGGARSRLLYLRRKWGWFGPPCLDQPINQLPLLNLEQVESNQVFQPQHIIGHHRRDDPLRRNHDARPVAPHV